MIFQRKRHKLPKFPPNIRATFKNLCKSLPAENVVSYKSEVDSELERIRTNAKENAMINLDLAVQLAQRCHMLLDNYDKFDNAKRALIVGAIRYFALSEDAFSEEDFASGFDDDARIMNYVLEQIGLEEHCIELE